jgi:hypothetical protein
MRFLRLLRIFIPLLLVAAIVAAVVVVLTSRNELQTSRKNVASSWTTLHGDLDKRYAALAFANDAVSGVPGPLHAIATKVTAGYNAWKRHGSVASQVNAANNLEALGRRLVLAARAAPRLQGNTKALSAIATYAGMPPPATAAAYNDAVAHFERERNRPARSVAAQLLGYDTIPAYAVSPSTTSSSPRATTTTITPTTRAAT